MKTPRVLVVDDDPASKLSGRRLGDDATMPSRWRSGEA
jgi:hypothetical protein